MRLRLRNIRVFRINSDTCRLEAEIGADQQKPILSFLEKLRGFDISAELSKWTKKRSLDANAYAWVLMTKIADALTASKATVTKDDVYLDMLKSYGQGGVVKIKDADAEKWKRAWKYTEPHEKLTQENAQYWRFWVGSSEYDSAEMSVFINGIIEEAKELGVETLAPDELERMMGQWGRKPKA
jgi:hypothetical protein